MIRSLKDIKNEPKLSMFHCLHGCSKTFKTTRGLLEHTQHCSENDDADEDPDNMYIDENVSVIDKIGQYDLEISIVKQFIKTGELGVIQHQTGEQIREYIHNKLCVESLEKCIVFNNFDLNIATYVIYKFFFGLTEEENSAFKKLWLDQLRSKLW